MDCDPRPEVNCDYACNCAPQTATVFQMVNASVTKFDTELTVQGEAPCCGFGLWKPCPTGQSEIFMITNAVYNPINDTTTLTIVRGLAFSGCDFTGDSNLAFSHTAVQELIIGDVGIHYYYCALCARMDCLEENCCKEDYDEILLIEDPHPGDRCVAWNDGEPIMYIYDCFGELGWIPLWDCDRTRACLSAADPITYDENTGEIGLNYYNCHFTLGAGGRLELLVPQAVRGHAGYQGVNRTFNAGNDGTILAESDITIPAVAPGACNLPTLITLMWQIDNNPQPTGGDPIDTSQGWGWNIMRSVNGGPFVLYASDYQERQRTNWGANDTNGGYNDNDMQTIPFFDIVTDRSLSYSYRLQYDYLYFNANIQVAQISKDYSYITLAR